MTPPPAREILPRASALRLVWLLAGWGFLGLGLIGALLPVLPTTVFLILATWCFGRASPRLEAKLLAHPVFGPALQAWRRDGAVPLRAKWLACLGMALGYALFWWQLQPDPAAALVTGLAMLLTAGWLITRPTAPPAGAATQCRLGTPDDSADRGEL